MEDFIPLIIGLALFAIKAFSNFQKEQEKAKKRNPSQPQPDIFEDLFIPELKEKSHSKPASAPEPFLFEEKADSYNPYEPRYKTTYKEPGAKVEYKEKKVLEAVNPEVLETKEGYDFERPSKETLNNRKFNQTHNHTFDHVEQDEEGSSYEFDMRDAIIKEAILNRPPF